MKICVLGGGNLAHSYAAELKQNPFNEVFVVTRKPQKWNHTIETYRNWKYAFSSTIDTITDDYSIVKEADVVVFPLPAQARYEVFSKIKPYLQKNTMIIVAPSGGGGVNFLIDEFNKNQKYVLLQRVSYISRLIEYGKKVNTDLKTNIDVYFSKNCNIEDKKLIKGILGLKLNEITSIWPLLLSNSNPILHIARLVSLLDEKDYPKKEIQLLYGNWSDETSSIALKMDNEMGEIIKKLKVKEYRSLLEHYEVKDAKTLTTKLKSLPAFKKLLIPMVQHSDNKFYIDENSRYILEDLPYGTIVIKHTADLLNIKTPTIDYVLEKLQFLLNKKIIQNGKLDIEEWKKITGYDLAGFIKQEIEKSCASL